MLETMIALLMFLFPLAYSPGPGNLFFAAVGARFGLRATLPANAGYHAATWIVAAAMGFGAIALLDRFPQVFPVLKVAGSLYVLRIAWKMIRAGIPEEAGAARPASFADGAILLVLNPKAYVIMALMFSQFLDGAGAAPALAVLLIATVFTLNNLFAFLVWTLIGEVIAGWFASPSSARTLNAAFGALLAAVGVWMLLP